MGLAANNPIFSGGLARGLKQLARISRSSCMEYRCVATSVEGFVQQLRSNVYRLKAVGASWTKRPASPAQLRLLGKLHVPCRPGLSSGEASNLIDLALARKGSRR